MGGLLVRGELGRTAQGFQEQGEGAAVKRRFACEAPAGTAGERGRVTVGAADPERDGILPRRSTESLATGQKPGPESPLLPAEKELAPTLLAVVRAVRTRVQGRAQTVSLRKADGRAEVAFRPFSSTHSTFLFARDVVATRLAPNLWALYLGRLYAWIRRQTAPASHR